MLWRLRRPSSSLWFAAIRITMGYLECGTSSPNPMDVLVDQARLARVAKVQRGQHDRYLRTEIYSELCQQCIEIEVHLHMVLADLGFGPFIPHPLPMSLGFLKEENAHALQRRIYSTQRDIFRFFEANVEIVNRSFHKTPFRFNWEPSQTKTATNNTWSNYGFDYMPEMSRALGAGDTKILDIYLVFRLKSTDKNVGTAIGVAWFPSSFSDRLGQGVWLIYDTITGGGAPSKDTGYTLVHEIGHWLGLLHTFQSSLDTDGGSSSGGGECVPGDPNDFIDDTPTHAEPSNSLDCTLYYDEDNTIIPLDTCPELPGLDPIFNYMNYVDQDICWQDKGEFTPNQIERMYRHYLLFREQATAQLCEDVDKMEIEIIFVWDKDHARDNWIRLVEDASGFVVFDSNEDYLEAVAYMYQESLSMDLCVPPTSSYTLNVYDRNGDGFSNGRIDIFRHGVLMERVEGALPPFLSVVIPALVVTLAPTNIPTLHPTETPTVTPTASSLSASPSQAPTTIPSKVPTDRPTTSNAVNRFRPGSLWLSLMILSGSIL